MADTEAGKGTMQQILETLVGEIDASVTRALADLAPLQTTTETLTVAQVRGLTAAHIAAVKRCERLTQVTAKMLAAHVAAREVAGMPVTEEETREACGCPSCKAPRPNVAATGMVH